MKVESNIIARGGKVSAYLSFSFSIFDGLNFAWPLKVWRSNDSWGCSIYIPPASATPRFFQNGRVPHTTAADGFSLALILAESNDFSWLQTGWNCKGGLNGERKMHYSSCRLRWPFLKISSVITTLLKTHYLLYNFLFFKSGQVKWNALSIIHGQRMAHEVVLLKYLPLRRHAVCVFFFWVKVITWATLKENVNFHAINWLSSSSECIPSGTDVLSNMWISYGVFLFA